MAEESKEGLEIDFDKEEEPKTKPKKASAKADKKEKSTKKKKKKKSKKSKKWVGILIVVLLLFAVFVLPRFLAPKGTEIVSVYSGDIYVVGQRTVEDTISATGLIESHEDTTAKVYSTLTYEIDKVNVSLGDKVNAGDVLCVYDTEKLDRSIREKELSMSSSERAASLSLANAKLSYDTYRTGMEEGTNASINTAQSNYDTALDNYNQAKEDYDEYVAKNDSAEIIVLNSAKRDFENATEDYEDFKKEIDEGTNLTLRQAKRSLDTALDNYEDYKDMVDDDETAELLSASANADAAYTAYKESANELKALKSLLGGYEKDLEEEEAKETPDAEKISDLKSEIKTLEKKVTSLQKSTDKLHEAYYAAEDAYDNASTAANMTLETYETAYENAKDNYDSVVKSLNDQLDSYKLAMDKAQDAYTTALENVDDQIEAYETAMNNAKRKLDDAELALSNTKISANDQLESYRISYQNAKNGTDTSLADYQLASLYEDLAKTTVTAPISGTVTAVYATEGETATGVMFVIEDTENLVVTSTVKAYDLDSVYEGMRVKIETDASGDEVFYGVIDSIAPTAAKDANGNIISTNDAEFDTVVLIDGETDALRIGVSAQIEYIIDEARDATAVPASAVLSDKDGSYVITAVKNEGNTVTLSRTSVSVGVSDGIYTVVSGIEAGASVADNAENYVALVGQTVSISNIDTSLSGGGGMMGMMMNARMGGM